MTSHWEINLFGVRHLSPSGAWHLRRYLDRLEPDLVMVEGLHDAVELIGDLVNQGTKPPVAILAYTDSLPVRTLVYPLAIYSPEYQAVLWAHENRKPLEFIDLPSDAFLGLQELEMEFAERMAQELPEEFADDRNADGTLPDSESCHVTVYDRLAEISGETSYDAYWERRFEHNLNEEAYRLAANALGASLRALDSEPLRRRAENLVREAFMRRQIERALARGIRPEKIVAIVGAYHAPVLNGSHLAMSDKEFESLPRRASKLTLMPYSYFRFYAIRLRCREPCTGLF